MADRIEGSTWIPGEGGTQGGARGGARAVWHSTEGPSIAAAVSAYRSHRGWPHATWDPSTGEVAQHLLPGQSARSVQNLGGGVETNRYGRVLQIEVVAHAAEPFTDRPMHGLDRILAWLRDNGVTAGWPMGQPLAYGPDERRPGVSPAAYGLNNGNRSPDVWVNQGGHYAHSQVPENDHGDPGRVDIARLGNAPQLPTFSDDEDSNMVKYVHPANGLTAYYYINDDGQFVQKTYGWPGLPGWYTLALDGNKPGVAKPGEKIVIDDKLTGTMHLFARAKDGKNMAHASYVGGKWVVQVD
jgi:hypothetical protein